jgi:hypothetical protein
MSMGFAESVGSCFLAVHAAISENRNAVPLKLLRRTFAVGGYAVDYGKTKSAADCYCTEEMCNLEDGVLLVSSCCCGRA